MGGYYNVYSVNGKRTFHYRFTCGKCHKTTPWNSCSIEVKHSIQTKSSLSQVQQQLDEGLSKKLNDRIDAVKREVESGYLFLQPSMAQNENRPHGKCPYCGQDPKHKGAVSEASIICGIIGFFAGGITCVILACLYVLETFPPMIMITIAATVAGAVIGAITEKKRERKRVDHTNVEYWWNDVLPIGMMGTPQTPKNNVTSEKLESKSRNIPIESTPPAFILAKNMTFSKYAAWGENEKQADDAIKDINEIDLLKELESVAASNYIKNSAYNKRKKLLHEKREQEVRNEQDQTELIRIAKDGKENLSIRMFIISELLTDKTALSYFVENFSESVIENKNIDRRILIEIVTSNAHSGIVKSAYRKLQPFDNLEIATIILNSLHLSRELLNKTNDPSLLREVFHTQGGTDLSRRNMVYEKLENHNIEIAKKINEILDKRIDDHCSFEKCNGRASLIEELIELLKNDEFAAKGFWESLRRENELSNHFHVPGNWEGGEGDWYFSDYNLENFPPYPFK